MSKQLRLDVAQLTDVGRKRPHNEDNMAYVIPKDSQVMAKKGALFIVADGMGGHAAGEVASEIAVDTVSTAYYQDENEEIPLSLMNAIKRANALIHQRAAENMMRSGMGTTCVAAVVRGGVAYIANVGDSRAYLVRHGQSKQVSQDHSWVEEQVRAGLLTKDQARSHAQRNVITRALGTQAEVDVDVFSEILEDSDTFVLCSDGLSGPVGEDDLRAIINQYLPQESVYHLVERANENGGPDNITAIVIRIQEAGEDIPSALQHPVRVGSGGHVADESTAILDRVPTSSLGMPSPAMRVEEDRSTSRPLHTSTTGTLYPVPSGDMAPLAVTVVPKAKKKRSRLVLPAVLLIVVLLLAGIGTAVSYFFLRPSDIQAGLNQADSLIQQSKGNISTNPSNALTSLTKAQGYLSAAKSASLSPQQNDQLNTLQNEFTSEFKSALTAYDSQSSVALLPCATFTPATLSPTTSTSAIATVPVDKNLTASYILGLDYNLYQVTAQNTLQKVSTSTVGTDKILLIASDGTYLYTLTEAQAGSGFTYRFHAYKPQQNGQLVEKAPGGTVINSSMLQSGQVPQLMTVWDGDIYIIATSSQSNQNQATILNYNVNNLNANPTRLPISISTGLVSAAALPSKQLFLLHSDGQIRSLNFETSKPFEMNVLLQGSVATPWSQDAQTFNVATPVATPTAPIANVLTIPAPNAQTAQALLAASDINNVQHLYVADNANHRVLDFTINPAVTATSTPVATPTPAATSVRAGGGVIGSASGSDETSASLQRQYVSSSVVSDVKGLSFDARTNQINLLTGMRSSSASNQVRIPVSSAAACVPTP